MTLETAGSFPPTVLLQEDLSLGPKNRRQKELEQASCEAVMMISQSQTPIGFAAFWAVFWILQFVAALEHVGR